MRALMLLQHTLKGTRQNINRMQQLKPSVKISFLRCCYNCQRSIGATKTRKSILNWFSGITVSISLEISMNKDTWYTKLTFEGKREYDRRSLEVISFNFSHEVIMKSKSALTLKSVYDKGCVLGEGGRGNKYHDNIPNQTISNRSCLDLFTLFCWPINCDCLPNNTIMPQNLVYYASRTRCLLTRYSNIKHFKTTTQRLSLEDIFRMLRYPLSVQGCLKIFDDI